MTLKQTSIRHATFPKDTDCVQQLFQEYAQWVNVDLSFQGFQAELHNLPGTYAQPNGTVLLLDADHLVAGCVALRPLKSTSCEMKRLFVRQTYRGQGYGRQLAQAVMNEAKQIGYEQMYLDTLAQMNNAKAIYRSLGFRPTEPYYYNPMPDTEYLCCDL